MIRRDIFAFNALGVADPSLDLVLEALPDSVRLALLGAATDKDARARVRVLEEEDRKDEAAAMLDIAELILRGAAMDRDDLEPILANNEISYGKDDSTHEHVYSLIQKLTFEKASALLAAAIKPGAIASRGVFADYKAKDLDLSKVKPLAAQQRLEAELERLLTAKSTDPRRAKVRLVPNPKTGQLLIAIYFERPATDGRDLEGAEKRLVTRPFKQPLGATFVHLRRARKHVVVTLRAPQTRQALQVRQALSAAIWGKPGEVSVDPMATFDLDVFAKASFRPTILPEHVSQVGSVVLGDIEVTVASENVVRVHAAGRTGDALDDFRLLLKTNALFKSFAVESATLKFLSPDERPRLITSAKVTRRAVTLDQYYRGLVEDHLDHWGIRGDAD